MEISQTAILLVLLPSRSLRTPPEDLGPGSGARPGQFPRHPPRISPSYVPLAERCLSHLSL
eukprot:2136367-Pyramimonas_sp.AAC.1